MDNEYKKKGNIGLVIIIVLLSFLVVMLGYYFVSHELLNNKSDNEIVDNNKDIEEKEDNEEKEIEYTFDADKIINKDTTYRYSLASENKNANAITDEKTTNGYKLCCKGSCKEINGDFTTVLGVQMFKGGPGVTGVFKFLVSTSGEIYYANLSGTEQVITGSVSQVKDVVKLYAVDLDSDRTASPYGLTVVAQTKDGSLYDIYDYVMQH